MMVRSSLSRRSSSTISTSISRPAADAEIAISRHQVRLYNKLIDEYLHNACTILTFATAFRPNFLKMPREAWLAEINKAPLKRRAEYKRSVIEHGLDSESSSTRWRSIASCCRGWRAPSERPLAGDRFSNATPRDPLHSALELLQLASSGTRIPPSPTGGRACASVLGQGGKFSIA